VIVSLTVTVVYWHDDQTVTTVKVLYTWTEVGTTVVYETIVSIYVSAVELQTETTVVIVTVVVQIEDGMEIGTYETGTLIELEINEVETSATTV
jgi:hypothetical protein